MIKYEVSCNHVSPRFAFKGKLVTVKPAPGHEGYWYAVSDGLGCSRDYRNADDAARSLFYANACTNIQITNLSECEQLTKATRDPDFN